MAAQEQALPTTDQLVAFLSSPSTYDASVTNVTCIETHGAYVFLAGAHAYKMKKPVDLGFLNFSTLERREKNSRNELRLNKHTAPDIYQKIVPITQESPNQLALDGPGRPVEWLVVMRRFDENNVLDKLVKTQGCDAILDRIQIEKIAQEILAFHANAQQRRDKGGADAALATAHSNHEHLLAFSNLFEKPEQIDALLNKSLKAVQENTLLLNDRRANGFVRRCHGDLHLGNIVLENDQPVLFDCIEFSEEIGTIDVLYDLAFLLMDLLKRGASPQANWLLNSYLLGIPFSQTPDMLRGLSLMPLFLSTRSAVRAHVTARTTQNTSLSEEEKHALIAQANSYLDLALKVLTPAPAQMIAIGGLSGTGKSTLARRLAPAIGQPQTPQAPPHLGAILLRTDELRKKRHNVSPTTRLSTSAYSAQSSAEIYEIQRRWADIVLSVGHSVIVDGVFAKTEERTGVEDLAAALNVPFYGFWLEAPSAVLMERVGARQGDASDADTRIVKQQTTYEIGQTSWTKINASGPLSSTESQVLRRLI